MYLRIDPDWKKLKRGSVPSQDGWRYDAIGAKVMFAKVKAVLTSG